MNSKPILFSAPMIRALLDGRKTQTRRALKKQPPFLARVRHAWFNMPIYGFTDEDVPSANWWKIKCPYGQPGDLLWVKETWCPTISHSCAMDACDCADVNVQYAAGHGAQYVPEGDIPGEWTMPKAAARGNVSSLFMPRWASRLTLRIKSVRVERLNQISREDAIAEGLSRIEYKGESFGFDGGNPTGYGSATGAFRALWESINGAGSWDANPWVWVVEFEVINKNVDEVIAQESRP